MAVTCGPSPGNPIAVDMGGFGPNEATVALVNAPQLMPGAIVYVRDSATPKYSGTGTALYVLRTSEADFLPSQPEQAFGTVVSARFDVDLDNDVRKALRSLNIRWSNRIAANTTVMTGGMRRHVLRDPIGLLNNDKAAITIMRGVEDGGRFVVVSAVSYGALIAMESFNYTSSPAVALNTLEVPNFYLHLKYTCATLDTLNSRAKQVGTAVPMLFFYSPIRLDSDTGLVRGDSQPIDLSEFDLTAIPAR